MKRITAQLRGDPFFTASNSDLSAGCAGGQCVLGAFLVVTALCPLGIVPAVQIPIYRADISMRCRGRRLDAPSNSTYAASKNGPSRAPAPTNLNRKVHDKSEFTHKGGADLFVEKPCFFLLLGKRSAIMNLGINKI